MKEKLTDVEKLLVKNAVVVSPRETRQPFFRYVLWTALICIVGFLIGFYLVK